MIRILDLFFSGMGLIFSFPVLVVLWIMGSIDTGSPIFKQERVGLKQKAFTLYKFRTMKLETKSVATHLITESSVTKLGAFLRKTKLDELPQLWNVFKGEMSLVGPRPCLFNQEELITEREKRKVFNVLPGITGLAQINDIDMSTPKILAEWDQKMINAFGTHNYFKYIFATVSGRGSGDRIKSE